MRWLAAVLAVACTACSYVEETRETGHKGRARIDPYLAAERLLERLDQEVLKEPGWPDFDEEDQALVLMPVSVLAADGYVNELEDWVIGGGHAVLFLEHGESHLNDWRRDRDRLGGPEDPPAALGDWLGRLGMSPEGGGTPADGAKNSATSVRIGDEEFEVWMESEWRIRTRDGEVMIASAEYGEGRLTVMADASPFRNRYIGDYEHASLLAYLVEISPYYGSTSFVRDASLSFWALLGSRAWAFLVALLVLTGFWLWKNLPRFGPLDSREVAGSLRAYDHHLEALGDFHWRLDRGEGLLRPLREALLERAHRLALASGRVDADVFELMAGRAGIPRERVERAMTFERARDAGSFTRLVADLQKLHVSII